MATANSIELSEKAEELRDKAGDSKHEDEILGAAAELDLLAAFGSDSEEEEDEPICAERKRSNTGGNSKGKYLSASNVLPLDVEWLDDGYRFPFGENVLIVGDSGVGKTLLTLRLAADFTRGRKTPEGTPGEAGNVIMVSPEDSIASKLVPGLMTADADLNRVFFLNKVDVTGERSGQAVEARFRLPEHLGALEDAINELGAGLVILDPFMAIVSKKVATGRNQSVRQEIVEPLEDIASRTGACLVMVGHFNKGSLRDLEAIKRTIGGSKGLTDAYRTIHVVLNTDQPNVKMVYTIKHNIGPQPTDLLYEIESVSVNRVRVKFTRGFSPTFIETYSKNVVNERQDSIIRVLEKSNRPLSSREINQLANVRDYEDCRDQLRRLVDKKYIGYPYRNQYCSLAYLATINKDQSATTTATTTTKEEDNQ